MSNAVSTENIDKLVASLDRPQLLAMLGVDENLIQVGDNEATRSISASSVNPVVIYQSDVPFLGKIHANCCSGAIIRRFKNATVGVPCYSHELESDSKFCNVCDEIWSVSDDRGFYKLNYETMPNAAAFYAPAKSGVLWRLPFMVTMEEFFSEEIQVVKDMFEGSELELDSDWPNMSFQDVASDILIKSGVLHRDADKSKNPYRRDEWEHCQLAEYLRKMLSCWLRIRTVIEPDALEREIKALHRTAKSVGIASMWRIQRAHRRLPILVGPLVPADIMLAGFRAACEGFKVMLHNVNTDKIADTLEVPDFQWGTKVEVFREWASKVQLLRRPVRKSAPKYMPPRPVTPTKKKRSGAGGSGKNNQEASAQPASPSQVRYWYAAKNTARPGAYVYKDVAESYNFDNSGTVKQFTSLAAARKWLEMPAPRMYYERECYKTPAPTSTETQHDEFFAIKGGTNAGVYTSMEKACIAKEEGGGTFAVFTLESEARKFAKGEMKFVVWAGRSVGVMTKQQCIAATQRIPGAKMRGPMSEDKAKQLWSSLQAGAKVLSGSTSSPKKNSKKKGKKFYYAVAVGKVPGVYDDWKEAERQVKNVRPSLHAKFETKKLAQEFVDSHSKTKTAPRAASPTHSTSDAASEASGSATASPTPESQNSFGDGDEDSQSQGTSELEIDMPSMGELEQAEAEGKVRVYACHTEVGKARIAVSFEKAIEDVNNPEVQVVNSETTLLDNLAVAEVRLRASGKRKSLSDRLAEARARAGARSHAHKSSGIPAPSISTSGAYRAGMLVNRSAVGRAKETQMIQYYFIDCPTPIKVVHGADVPFTHELDDEMELPNSKAIFNVAGQVKDLTITDFFKAKEKAISAWPLLGFQDFMRVCRKAQRMCQASSKATAVVNAAALGELMDICLQVHRTYERMGTLGTNENRFKARMYLHLQHTVTQRICYAGAVAMTVFDAATDPFYSRLPCYLKASLSESAGRQNSGGKPRSNGNLETSTPTSGCYLCPATDHYCNDPKFHPLVNGKHKPLSTTEKEAIIKRIDSSALSPALKTAEKKSVRRYWSQRGL